MRRSPYLPERLRPVNIGPTEDVWDDRAPAVLIHGSFTADPLLTWEFQRPLARDRRLIVGHRRGYGNAAARETPAFDPDVDDAVHWLGTGTHLVGFSYGGLIAMLTAARYPDLVRSLTLIEPPAFGIARDDPIVHTQISRHATLYPTARFTPEQYRAAFLSAVSGQPVEPAFLEPAELRATRAAMMEAPPWEAPLDLSLIASARFSTLIFSGAWHAALDVVADRIARHLGAAHVVLPGAGHAVQRVGEAFNERLSTFWMDAERSALR